MSEALDRLAAARLDYEAAKSKLAEVVHEQAASESPSLGSISARLSRARGG
jgi:hypothetical protein